VEWTWTTRGLPVRWWAADAGGVGHPVVGVDDVEVFAGGEAAGKNGVAFDLGKEVAAVVAAGAAEGRAGDGLRVAGTGGAAMSGGGAAGGELVAGGGVDVFRTGVGSKVGREGAELEVVEEAFESVDGCRFVVGFALCFGAVG
jgi:hypothetical protein